jgi:hypothetical protein
MPSIAKLVELGMVPPVALETFNQFTAVITPTARRFVEIGVTPVLANELSAQAGGARSATRLTECGMSPDLAREVVN